MTSIRSLFLVLAVLVVSSSPAAAEDAKTILFYGNSFTLGIGSTEAQTYGGVPEVVKQLAVAAGHPEPQVENAAVSGQTLAYHIANNTAVISNPTDFVEVPDFQWDTVVLQEYSTNPTHIGDPAGFRANAMTLLGLVRNHSPGVRGVLFETWARGPGNAFYTGDPPTFTDPAQMQQELRDNYELARQELVAAYGANSTIVASVGDAWEATGWDDLHGSDIYHANTRGTYLTGLVIFGTVYGESTTVGLPKLFDSLTESEATALQVIADQYLPPGLKFDADDDGDIDAADFTEFGTCMAGPSFTYAALDDCNLMDGDDDADVDLQDYALMQAAAFELLPTLGFDSFAMTFTLGSGTDSQPNTVTTSDTSTPTVALAALDLDTLTPPTWLTVPASIAAGTQFSVAVDSAGLAVGSHYARVTATASGYEESSFTVTLNVTSIGTEQTLLFDFGETAQPTVGNYNNITQAQDPVLNAVDTNGINTGVTLTVTDAFWPGSNQSGTASPTGDAAAIFDGQATRDNLFGNTVLFGGFTEPTAGFTLGGLSTDPGVTYSFTFFAARLGVSDNRETAYDVAGANSAVGYLNTSNNQSEVVTVSGIVADANGEIVVSVGPGPNNNNASGFYYLGAMQIVRNVP